MASKIALSITAIESAGHSTPLVLRGPFAESIRKAARFGYDAIELHIKNPVEVDTAAVDAALRETGLQVSSIGTGPSYSQEHIFLTADDEDIRARAKQRMIDHIELGARWNSVVILGLMKGQQRDSAASVNEYNRRLADGLAPVLQRAETLGVTLAVEVIDRFESDWLNTVEEGLNWIKEIDSPALGLHLDTFHMNIEEGDCPSAIRLAGNAVKHIHVADSDRWYPGHAHYDFAADFAALHEIGYQGAAALESFLYPDEEICARKAIETLRPLV